jgi:hypothetical protein
VHKIIITTIGIALLVATTTVAQRPPENVSPRRHPNLAAAQRLVDQAFNAEASNRR